MNRAKGVPSPFRAAEPGKILHHLFFPCEKEHDRLIGVEPTRQPA